MVRRAANRIGTAALVAIALLAAATARDAVAAPAGNEQNRKAEASMMRSAGARHRYHAGYVYRPPCPEYIDRPCYYAPKPFFSLPPIYGYGWEWW